MKDTQKRHRGARALPAALAALLVAGCGHPSGGGFVQPVTSPGAATADSASGSPLLPDPRLTPGATLDVTVRDISVPGYTRKVRDVPVEVKRQVYDEYGIAHHPPGQYEVDHLISLELGGSNSIKNLWPQSYVTHPWNAHVKDDLENRLHDLVVSGQVPLATAQHDISTNWIAAYKKYMGSSEPLPVTHSYARSRRRRTFRPTASPDVPVEGAAGQVWVNTRSGKYFQPGSPYYGHTKEGRYMTETQAQQQGYIAARG